MKKIGFFGLAAVILGAMVLPTAAFAQSYYYSNYPYNYPYYNDNNGDVSCFPETQTVEEGQLAYFIAYGGDGEYDWDADGHSYNNRDRNFSHVFDDTGSFRVDVESDNERDTCRVTVVRRGYYPTTYPAYPTYTAPVNVVTTYIPKGLPNTGFPPVSSAAVAFAAVLLLGVGLAVTPYAKKIAASVR